VILRAALRCGCVVNPTETISRRGLTGFADDDRCACRQDGSDLRARALEASLPVVHRHWQTDALAILHPRGERPARRTVAGSRRLVSV